MVMLLASAWLNIALKYAVDLVCRSAGVSVGASFAIASAVASSADCMPALIELARL